MNLLDDETVVLESDNNELVLSTHRVRFNARTWGRSHVTSLMLDQVCSCEIRYWSHPVLLVMAAAALILGLASDDGARIGLLVALVCLIIYWLGRRQVLTIRSAGAAINARMSGGNVKTAERFIDEVERLKNRRHLGAGVAAR